ncbi:MAG: hypothetical protein ABJG88_03900 [Litorimonas sp.]
MSSLERNQRNLEAWVNYYRNQNSDFDFKKRQEYRLTYEQVQQRAVMGFNDFPLTLFWKSDEDFAKYLGFKGQANSHRVLNSLVIDLLRAAQGGQSVYYSRNGNSYSTHYTGVMGRSTVVGALEFLVEQGLALNFIVPKGTNNEISSFIYATPLLIEKFLHVVDGGLYVRDKESRIVTFKQRKPEKYLKVPESNFFIDAEKELVQHNAIVAAVEIDITGNVLRRVNSIVTIINHKNEEQTIDLNRRFLSRRFNKPEPFSKYEAVGGRYYGAFWQNMSEADRSRITINGEPVGKELDYSCVSLQIAYACVGQRLLPKGSYSKEVGGYNVDISGISIGKTQFLLTPEKTRKIVKKATQIMMNTTSVGGASKASGKELQKLLPEVFSSHTKYEVSKYAEQVIHRILKHHSAIAKFFFSDFGVESQFIDSEIMTEFHKNCREQDIPILSIHDSILYPESKKPIVEPIFNEALETRLEMLISKSRLQTAA